MPGVTAADNRTRRSRHVPPPSSSSSRSANSNLAGCIRWLLPQSDCDVSINIPPLCYDHPLVILSAEASVDETVEIFLVTSFQGRSLEQAHPKKEDVRKRYLPIKPSKKHPDNGILLSLAAHCRDMDKPSFVNTGNRRTVPLGSMRNCNGRDSNYRLSRESYVDMLRHCEYVPVGTSSWDLYFEHQEIIERRERSSMAVEGRPPPIRTRQLPGVQEHISSPTTTRIRVPASTSTRAVMTIPGAYPTEHGHRPSFRATISEPPARVQYGTMMSRYSGPVASGSRPLYWSEVSSSQRPSQHIHNFHAHSLPGPPGSRDWRVKLLITIFAILCWLCVLYVAYQAGLAVVDMGKAAWAWIRETWDKIKLPF